MAALHASVPSTGVFFAASMLLFGHPRPCTSTREEVQGRTPLLPAGPPYRHQHGLRSRTDLGPAATPDRPEDDTEADGQFGRPVGGVVFDVRVQLKLISDL